VKQFWEERYGAEEYVYGTTPNEFFAGQLTLLKPGTLLLPGEGEGRNAVYAASLGWDVTAIDLAKAGKIKAEKLAAKFGVQVNYIVSNLVSIELPEEHYDLIALVYAHFPPELRASIHQKMVRCLKIGGILALEGFSKKQLGNPSGGPKNEAMLFSKEELLSDFIGLKTLKIEESTTFFQKGLYHQGNAEVIQYIGIKNDKKTI